MTRMKSEATRQQEFVAEAEAMYVRLRAWRAAHPDASFDDIGEQLTVERRQLMARLYGELAVQPEAEGVVDAVCEECGAKLVAKGKQERGVSHLEGDVRVKREYQRCEVCQRGFFPPRP
jgi:hypothetical protein